MSDLCMCWFILTLKTGVMMCLANILQLVGQHSVCSHEYLVQYLSGTLHWANSCSFLQHLSLQESIITAGVAAHVPPLLKDQIHFCAMITRKCSCALLEFICLYEMSISWYRT